jgi:hypothetical protein
VQRLDFLGVVLFAKASCHHWPRLSVPSSSSSMVEPALMPFGPFTAVLPRISDFRRA